MLPYNATTSFPVQIGSHCQGTLALTILSYDCTYTYGFINGTTTANFPVLYQVSSSSPNSSTSPFYTQDVGNLSFGLAIIITLIFLMVVGFAWNNMTSKKPWSR